MNHFTETGSGRTQEILRKRGRFVSFSAGQYAHTQAEKYDCANGVDEFWATGDTMAAAEFSPNCPGDCKQKPQPVNHTAMVAVAGPGSFNDADMCAPSLPSLASPHSLPSSSGSPALRRSGPPARATPQLTRGCMCTVLYHTVNTFHVVMCMRCVCVMH